MTPSGGMNGHYTSTAKVREHGIESFEKEAMDMYTLKSISEDENANYRRRKMKCPSTLREV